MKQGPLDDSSLEEGLVMKLRIHLMLTKKSELK